MMRICASFYAVARGRTVGVFNSWAECQRSVEGFSGAIFKKFPSKVQAAQFIEGNRNPIGVINNPIRKKEISKPIQSQKKVDDGRSANSQFEANEVMGSSADEKEVVVYTDGACSRNGFRGAKAGFGVFWGPGHPDNVSEPLNGAPTNNRAEYMAVIRAMEKALDRCIQCLVIRTDSQLLIQSVTKWIHKWKTNGWRTLDGKEVRNRDLLVRMVCERDMLMTRIKVRFEKVKGHSGDYEEYLPHLCYSHAKRLVMYSDSGNEQADLLARRGAELYSAY